MTLKIDFESQLYRISSYSFRTFMYCDLWPYILWPLALCTVTFGFPNSKKNSFRGNYMRKYGMSFSTFWRMHYKLTILKALIDKCVRNCICFKIWFLEYVGWGTNSLFWIHWWLMAMSCSSDCTCTCFSIFLMMK